MEYRIGVDAGLETIKFVAVADTQVVLRRCIPATGESINTLVFAGMRRLGTDLGWSVDRCNVGVTGMAAKFTDATRNISESACAAAGITAVCPDAKSVLDMGSERSIAIRVSEGRALRIARNERCAAGSGRFLCTVAEIMGLEIEEIGPLALSARAPVQIESTCAVFGESEIISMIHSKVDPANILAGVYRGLASRLYALFSRIAFEPKVACIGGVSMNVGLMHAIEEQLQTPVHVPEGALFTKALGAAILAGGVPE